jgi:hypothetical protein
MVVSFVVGRASHLVSGAAQSFPTSKHSSSTALSTAPALERNADAILWHRLAIAMRDEEQRAGRGEAVPALVGFTDTGGHQPPQPNDLRWVTLAGLEPCVSVPIIFFDLYVMAAERDISGTLVGQAAHGVRDYRAAGGRAGL